MGYPNTTGTATEQSRRSKVLPGIPFDLPCARRHAELWASLEAEGKRIGAHDMIIAATGLRFGLEVARLNESESARVAGLKLANARAYLKTF